MKTLITFIILMFCLAPWVAEGKTRVAVSTFKDKSADSRCNVRRWFGTNLGSGFQEQMITALSDTGKFSLQERENLNKMYREEHQLVNSDSSAAPRKNRFKAAHYSITGAVTSFELCAGGIGGKVDVGGLFGMKNSGLKVGGNRSKAKVAMDIRVVDVETGEILKSFTTKGSASGMGIEVDGDIKGADFKSDAFTKTPLGEATREAIEKAAEKIVKLLPGDRKDAPKMAKASKSKKTKRKPRSKTRKKRTISSKSSKSSLGKMKKKGQQTRVQVNQLCPHRYSHLFQACKTISKSKTGKRTQVLMMEKSEKKTLAGSEIMPISKVSSAPKLGDTVFVHCQRAELGCSFGKHLYKECTVVDSLDSESILSCGGEEYQIPQSIIFKKK